MSLPRLGLCLSLLLVGATPLVAQDAGPARWWLAGQVGLYHHASDVHEYYDARFVDRPIVGLSATYRATSWIAVRIGTRATATRLAGADIVTSYRSKDDLLFTAELDALLNPPVWRVVQPYAGLGLGMRRSTINDYTFLGGDVVYDQWARLGPQVQPTASAFAGLSAPLGRFRVGAELRVTTTRLRSGNDDWGLPASPLARQTELAPSVYVALPLHR